MQCGVILLLFGTFCACTRPCFSTPRSKNNIHVAAVITWFPSVGFHFLFVNTDYAINSKPIKLWHSSTITPHLPKHLSYSELESKPFFLSRAWHLPIDLALDSSILLSSKLSFVRCSSTAFLEQLISQVTSCDFTQH